MSQFQKLKGQASFEFVVILSIVVLLATAFIYTISNEYSETFVLSAVKNSAEKAVSAIVLTQPGCYNTTLKSMKFSPESHNIALTVFGCPIDIPKIASSVETGICGARNPSGSNIIVCNGIIYTITSV